MAVGSCGGPQIPIRGGRVDAIGGGEFGVPEPESSIEDTLGRFQLAGFDRSDSITLTACGHTMGNVHHQGFPQVGEFALVVLIVLARSLSHLVPASAVTPNNTGGGIHFDITPAVFDVNVWVSLCL